MNYIALILIVAPFVSAQEIYVVVPPTEENNNYYQQVSIVNSYGGQCSGSVIHERWILTSASCFVYGQNTNGLIVNVGSYSYGVERVIIHPIYIPDYLDNDILLVRLNADLNTNEVQQLILDLNNANDYRGSTISLNGELLQVVDESYCSKSTSNSNNFVCARSQYGQNCLNVGAGTPVILNNRQIGLKIGANQCRNQAHAFTRVSRYADWILNQIAVYGK